MNGPTIKKRRISNNVVKDNTLSKITATNGLKPQKDDSLKKNKKHIAKFRLKATGESAALSVSNTERIPLLLTDIQHLLLHSLLGNLNLSQPPRWYVLDKCCHISQTTCLIVEGISLQHWEKHKETFLESQKIYDDVVEILTPAIYNGSLVDELALVPLSEVDKEAIIQKYGSINLAIEARKDLMVMMKAVFPVGDQQLPSHDILVEEKFPRTQLILSAWQLIEENYPVPLKGKLKNSYSDYVMTKDVYEPVTVKSPMFGLDCEMCLTDAGSELTRVSIVNENNDVVYDSLVKPYNDITDYLTRYSGITKSLLSDVTKRLEDVQNDIRDLLPLDAILVGQSINLDLHALKMMHPYIIDTSIIFNFTGERCRKPKLKTLVKEFLNEDIQTGKKGHCSIEDALASLKLVKLKLSKSMEYGDAVHTNRQKYKENACKVTKTEEIALSIFNHMIDKDKSSLVVGCEDITGHYHTYLTKARESVVTQLKKGKQNKVKLTTVDDVEQVIETLSDAVTKYNFTMAHLKLDMETDTKSNAEQIKVADEWIKTIWTCLKQNALCVIVFGGTSNDNGIAMMKVKS